MLRAALFLAILSLFAGVSSEARAESIVPEAMTLGWQTERAEATVLADLGAVTAEGSSGRREATFAVRDVIRGDVKAGESLTIVFPDLGHGVPWVKGAKHLLFVSRRAAGSDAPALWNPVSGTYGIRTISEDGPTSRFPGMVRQIAATLADTGKEVEEPEDLLTLFLGWIDDEDPGVVWSAATDFARHRTLHPLLTEEQATGIVRAYRSHPIGKSSKEALAMAVAVSGHRDAGPVLVESLLLPKSRWIRGAVGDALVALDDPLVPKLLVQALAKADAPHRATLAKALGRVGEKPEVTTIRKLLKDEASAVRVEAAHALGLVARRVRKADSTARVDGRVELYRRVLLAKGGNEVRACLWALAQLDDATAYENLRRLADKDDRAMVRRLAKRYLDRPRVSLVLK